MYAAERTEDEMIAYYAEMEGMEDAYIPTAEEAAAAHREYVAHTRGLFGNDFWINPNAGGIYVKCKHCGKTATGQFADTLLYEHTCTN